MGKLRSFSRAQRGEDLWRTALGLGPTSTTVVVTVAPNPAPLHATWRTQSGGKGE